MRSWAACAVVLAGCFADPPDGSLRCAATGECPTGFQCAADGFCWHEGRAPDLSATTDDGGGGDASLDSDGSGGTDGAAACTPTACAALPCSTGACTDGGVCEPLPISTSTICGSSDCVDVPDTAGYHYGGQYLGGKAHIWYCDGVHPDVCPPMTTGMLSFCNPNDYACGPGGTCGHSCTVDLDCTFGRYCDTTTGVCKPTISTVAATACSRDAMCTSRVCVLNQCRECRVTKDCYMNQICSSNACTNCGTNMNPSPTCTAAGWGPSCTGTQCYCTTSSQCTNDNARYCFGGLCACGDGSNGGGAPCTGDRICTANDATGVCKLRTGQPCLAPGDCFSGACNTGLCG